MSSGGGIAFDNGLTLIGSWLKFSRLNAGPRYWCTQLAGLGSGHIGHRGYLCAQEEHRVREVRDGEDTGGPS